MNFGLSNAQYLILDQLVFKPLKLKHAEVYVFGSRARGQNQPFSDIDVLFKENSKNPITNNEISKIKEDIENSDLTIKVDLVRDTELAQSYRQSIEADMIPVRQPNL